MQSLLGLFGRVSRHFNGILTQRRKDAKKGYGKRNDYDPYGVGEAGTNDRDEGDERDTGLPGTPGSPRGLLAVIPRIPFIPVKRFASLCDFAALREAG